MKSLYTNLPPKPITNSDYSSVQAYDSYFLAPLELDAGTLDAMRSFFTSRGFDRVSAESVSVVMIKQAKRDNFNPLQLLDTLGGLTDVEINAVVSEIINYNRYKTSFLGYSPQFISNEEVSRNIAL
jgi:hypothetical protein